jgi:hypothetical protein
MDETQQEIVRLRADLLVMEQKLLRLTESKTSPAKRTFEVDWWVPIKRCRPDIFLTDLMANEEGAVLDPESIWRTPFSATDKALLNKKAPEVVKTPELSPEAWSLVLKDENLKTKGQGIQTSMVRVKDIWNIWIACIRSLPRDALINFPPETQKLFNCMSASLAIESASLYTDLRNIGRESIKAPMIDVKPKQYADANDTELFTRFSESQNLSNAIVMGMLSAEGSDETFSEEDLYDNFDEDKADTEDEDEVEDEVDDLDEYPDEDYSDEEEAEEMIDDGVDE